MLKDLLKCCETLIDLYRSVLFSGVGMLQTSHLALHAGTQWKLLLFAVLEQAVNFPAVSLYATVTGHLIAVCITLRNFKIIVELVKLT